MLAIYLWSITNRQARENREKGRKVEMEKKKSWKAWLDSRPHYKLHGWLNEEASTKIELPTILAAVGPFGVGKSDLIEKLSFRQLKKASSREIRRNESWLRQLDYQKWFYSEEARFEGAIMSLDWPQPEWIPLQAELGLVAPDVEDLLRLRMFQEFTGVFWMEEMLRIFEEVRSGNEVIALELSSVHLLDWLALLEKLAGKEEAMKKVVIVELEANTEILKKRLMHRRELQPEIDETGIITTARIFESAATPQTPSNLPELDGYNYWVFSTENDSNMQSIAKATREYCDQTRKKGVEKLVTV